MNIRALTADIAIIQTLGNFDGEVGGICFDSRKAEEGCLFIAVKGSTSDGHDFIEKATDNGAKYVLCEQIPEQTNSSVCYIQVKDSSYALGIIASAYYGKPSEQLTVVGVTGTNGKTSTATLLYHTFRRLGKKCGLLSTVCNYIEGEERSSSHTTPDPLEMNALMREMVDKSCEFVFMEVSSHSVVQKRIAGIKFDGGIFTNITRDHIDYHKTMDAYITAKKTFFDSLPSKAFALTNIDDKNGKIMLQNTKAKKYSYSLLSVADFKAKVLEESIEGMLLDINSKDVYVRFTGRFNAYNLLAVYGAASLLGIEAEQILPVLSILRPVAGRFDTIYTKKGFTAIIDYAHTPDALENVLGTINDIKKSMAGKPEVICIVGCGGNRDRGKRPMMGKIAATMSDKIIFTSDNPRMENPADILNEIVAGVPESMKNKYIVIENRHEAIKAAYAMAQKDDIVLIAGKGHENYQIIGTEKFHFDDKEEIYNLDK